MEIRNIDPHTIHNPNPMPIQRVSMPRTSAVHYNPSGPFKYLILRAIDNESNSRSTTVKDLETGGKLKGTLGGDEPYGDSPRAQITRHKAGEAENSDTQLCIKGHPSNEAGKHGPTPAPDDSNYCPKCGRRARESETHYTCPKCGLVEKPKLCPKCGWEMVLIDTIPKDVPVVGLSETPAHWVCENWECNYEEKVK